MGLYSNKFNGRKVWCIACLPKITTIQSQGHVHVHVHVGTTYIILPLLNIGSKINLQCVFEYVSYDTACKYILLQKAITKSTVLECNSFFLWGNSAAVMNKGCKFLKKLWCCVGGRV